MMKKIGIITHYNVHNHGAQLQLYALCAQLKQFGIDAKALQYKKNYDFLTLGIENKYSISVRSIPIYIKYLLTKGIKRTIYNFNKKNKLDNFRKEKALEGEYYSKAEDLDFVVIGSDEIFSLEPGLNPCFWGMGVPCKKVVSYAASCGPTTNEFIEKHFAEEFVEAGVKRLGKISVRDENSYNIISRYTDREISIVCDPVLLYDFNLEKEENKVRFGKNKYCIVYSYDERMNDTETVKAIKVFAKKRNLKVYSVGYYHKWCDKNIQVDPLELFSWFENADYIFTDTFHGTVLSIVCNTEFFAKISENQNKLGFLLQEYGLESRKIESFLECEILSDQRIDFNVLNDKIKAIREKSLKFLKDALEI